MAEEQTERDDGGGVATAAETLSGYGQPDGRVLRGRDRGRHRQGDGLPPDQGLGGRLRPDDLRPGVHQHGVRAQLGLLHRRRGGRARVPRLPDRGAVREVLVPRGRLSPDLRRAAHPGAAGRVDLRDHPPHLRPREHQEVRRGLPLRRPPDGDAARDGRRALHLLSGREEDRRRDRAPHGGGAADRQGADARRLRLPPQPRAAVRLSGQRPVLPRQLPLDDVQDDGGRSTSRTRGSSARSTSSGSCTRTTSRTARRTRCAAWARLRWTRTRRWPPAWPRCTARCTAAPTRPC